jgi:putative ABC transport system permease protein
MTVVMRAAGDPGQLAQAARQHVLAVDPDLPIFNVRTMERIWDDSVAPQRLNTLLLGIFGGVALLLAAVGIYGVMSYSVTQRTHELGIRMALGARPRDVRALVVRQGMTFVALGVGLGLAGALVVTRWMASLLYGVSASDPLTFGAIALLLAGVALFACFIPARRATRVDPIIALRHE